MGNPLSPRKKIIDRLLITLFPTLGVPNPNWLRIWQQQEFKAFTLGARGFFFTWFVVYGVHYWLVDIPAGKDHLELWAFQRAINSGANLVGLALTFTPWYHKSRFYRLPLLLITATTVHMQALGMSWRDDVPFFYLPLQALLGVTLLRLSPIVSVALLPLVLAAGKIGFVVRPGQNHHMVSASIVAAMLVLIFRSRIFADLRTLCAEQENLESQKRLVQAQQTLVDQLRSFLPREIYRKVEIAIKEGGLSPSQAVENVLHARATLAAVLYSDIRGFTRLTNDHAGHAVTAVIRAQQRGTELVEKFRGIPRLYGDQIYSYFDLESAAVNLTSALRSAFELTEETTRINKALPESEKITRYVIISFGKVTVGNIGSSEGARDITVLGAPANFPSRLDPLTKEPSLKALLTESQVLLSSDAFHFAKAIFPDLNFTEVYLPKLGLSIRDFPNENTIFLIPLSNQNWLTLGNEPNEKAALTFLEGHQQRESKEKAA